MYELDLTVQTGALRAPLNLLACACHAALDLATMMWKAVRREVVARRGFFQTMLALTSYIVFPSSDRDGHCASAASGALKMVTGDDRANAVRQNESCY